MPTGIWLYSYIALWGLLIVEGVVLRLVLSHVSKLYGREAEERVPSGLPAGAVAPEIELREVFGRDVEFGSRRARKKLIHFVSLSCPGCKELMKSVGKLRAEDNADVVLVVSGGSTDARLLVAQFTHSEKHPSYFVFADSERSLFRSYAVEGVPYSVLVGSNSRIVGGGFPVKELDILSLARRPDFKETPQVRTQAGQGIDLLTDAAH